MQILIVSIPTNLKQHIYLREEEDEGLKLDAFFGRKKINKTCWMDLRCLVKLKMGFG